jgi:hypothetical protein
MIQLSATGRYLDHKPLVYKYANPYLKKKRLALSSLYRTDVRVEAIQENNIFIFQLAAGKWADERQHLAGLDGAGTDMRLPLFHPARL